MFVAAWKFDVNFGAREELMKALKEFSSMENAWKAKSRRMLVGSIGAPESLIVAEYEFETLADLEASWDTLRSQSDLFTRWVTRMRPLIVPGSPHWEVYRVIDR
jgi:hypothetical protein